VPRQRPYMLTRRNLNLTSRLLARELGLLRRYELQDYAPALRWGCSDSPTNGDSAHNSPLHINVVANKLMFSSKLVENDIPHVRINRNTPTRFPVAVRTNLHGSQGNGIVVCRNIAEFEQYSNNYWTEWHNFRREYGVHILGGEIVKVFKKVWGGIGDEPEFPLRNTTRGYRYSLISHEGRFERLRAYMRRLYDVIPISMCRFDVGKVEGTGEYLVIEGNTAPGLSENESTRQLYVEYIRHALGGSL